MGTCNFQALAEQKSINWSILIMSLRPPDLPKMVRIEHMLVSSSLPERWITYWCHFSNIFSLTFLYFFVEWFCMPGSWTDLQILHEKSSNDSVQFKEVPYRGCVFTKHQNPKILGSKSPKLQFFSSKCPFPGKSVKLNNILMVGKCIKICNRPPLHSQDQWVELWCLFWSPTPASGRSHRFAITHYRTGTSNVKKV